MKNRSLTFIRALGEEYARKYNPGHLAPFPYESILKQHTDLEVYFVPLDDNNVSGVTLLKEGKINILVNTNKPDTRQNFTLGHELGHYFLHQDILKEEKGIVDPDATVEGAVALYRLDNEAAEMVEREANAFAASLLMPADIVKRGWRATSGDVRELAGIFRVSVVAMSIRLTELGLVK